MTKSNNKNKVKPKSSYTYLTSTNIKTYINSFRYEAAEQEILKDLALIFDKFGKIPNLRCLPTKNEDIRLLFNNYFPNSEDLSDFDMKSKLKKYFKKEHLNCLDVSRFWSNLVFGFNSILRKIEQGINIDLILIDKCLEDAPILEHLRKLTINKQGSEVTLLVFEHNQLSKISSCDIKKFNKLLMIGFLSKINVDEVSSFKKSLLEKIEPFKQQSPPDNIAEAKTITERKLPVKRKIVSDTLPYVINPGEINFLISTHSDKTKKKKNVPQNKDVDFLVDLKRVKVDETKNTKFIKPPDQQKKENKILKKKK